GEGKIVKIDESMFGKRKYNRGRIPKGQWVVGGIERGRNKMFFVPIVNQNTQTLTDII
ncbi:hypothetical protein DFS34DRAFT_564374, partial [Phlyctochytrium arcticum]